MLVDATDATVSSIGDSPTIKIVSADGSSVLLATSMHRTLAIRRSRGGMRSREQQKFSVTVLTARDSEGLTDED